MSVVVAPFNSQDAVAVKRLLIAGLSERWGQYEPRFNPDIETFPSTHSDSLVLVAKLEGVVVGTGALRPINSNQSEIVRMSTAQGNRRTGVASQILKVLVQHARHNGSNKVLLETTSSWVSAVAFYVKHGFIFSHERDGNSHFEYHLR